VHSIVSRRSKEKPSIRQIQNTSLGSLKTETSSGALQAAITTYDGNPFGLTDAVVGGACEVDWTWLSVSGRSYYKRLFKGHNTNDVKK
jgi:hypothetical protein